MGENCYLIMQDVNHQLFTESVLDEVILGTDGTDIDRAESILNQLDLLAFKERHPMSLSGGQKQRVAIAGAIFSGKDILLLMNQQVAWISGTWNRWRNLCGS